MNFRAVPLGSMILSFLISCFFYTSVFGAVQIPRNDLRLELLLSTGVTDTSGNGRTSTLTGISPTYISDTQYGVKHANFVNNGVIRTNSSWSTTGTGEFTISFWVKINSGSLMNNTVGNIVNLSQYVTDNQNSQYNKSYYDKPMVVFSAKSGPTDLAGLHLSLVQNGQCSLNGVSRNQSNYVGGYPWNGVGNFGDFFTQNEPTFSCGIADGKWHHIIITRKSGTLRMLVDNIQVLTNTRSETLSRVVNIGGYGVSPTMLPYYQIYQNSGSVLSDIMNRSHFKGGLLGFRLYSVGLSSDDIESLYNEYSFIRGNIQGTGSISYSIEGYANNRLTLLINNIPSSLSLNSGYTYEYSVNSGSFLLISNIQEVSSSGGLFSYRASLDLSSYPDGNLYINFNAKKGASLAMGSISFMKIENPTTITINSPNNDLTPAKYITAESSNGGVLSMALTRSSTCNNTLIFEEYSDLTFTNISDNGIRVCYRAIFQNQNNKTIYKLSPIIQGIQPTENTVLSPNSSLFGSYLLWRKSSYQKGNDSTYMMLDLIGTPNKSWTDQLGVQRATTTNVGNGISTLDINGDGLVDFLYALSEPVRRAIIVNNGNYTFNIVYKCAIDSVTSTNYPYPVTLTYYGDCADPTR